MIRPSNRCRTSVIMDVMSPQTTIEPTILAHAREVVATHLAPTPLVRLALPGLDRVVFAKLETLQPTGSFKVRGALSACAAYGSSGKRIVTASAGNHGLGIAHAAARLSVTATVVVPETASSAKVAALKGLDIDLRQVGADYDEAEAAALEMAGGAGRFLSGYNDPHVIAGQATVAAEILDQAEEPATVVVPVGGGGLASGVSVMLAGREGWRVIGVETEQSRGLSAAVEAGRVVTVPVGTTIADGLAGNLEPGSITADIVRASGTPVQAVGERAIRSAVRELATQAGLVVEGSAAVGLAALHDGLIPGDGPVVLVLTGRNISTGLFTEILRE